MTAAQSMRAVAKRILARWPALDAAVRPVYRLLRPVLDAAVRPVYRLLRRSALTLRQSAQVASFWRALLPPRGRSSWPPATMQVVMLVVSDLRIDPRVRRAAQVLAGAGFQVHVICPDISSVPLAQQPLDWGRGITFEILPSRAASFIMDAPWLLGTTMHEAAIRHRPYAIHCHDLTTAVIGLSAARTTGAYCLCDFHEWYSENVSWNAGAQAWEPHPWAKKACYRLAERLALRRADAVITVCDSIARELEAMAVPGTRRVNVIRNIPSLDRRAQFTYPPLRESLGLGADQFILLWQGGTGPSRMIEPIIEALAHAPSVAFVIRGPSLDLFGEGYRALARKCGVEDRLVLLPPVPSGDVVASAESADAGIWTLPNLSKNFYYALPNKIFEYLASGLPVLAANFPEARRMVEGYDVGLCFDPYDPRSIAAQLTRLATEPELHARLRANIPHALRGIGAEDEWGKLVRLYRDLADDATG